MKVKDKEKLNNPLKGWRILSAISSMVFHTVQWLYHYKGLATYFRKSCWDILQDYQILAQYLKGFTKAAKGSPVGKNPLC